MTNLSKLFRSLKIKTQFTIIEITLLLISLAITSIACKIFFNIFINILNDSYIAKFEQQDANQINNGAQYIKKIFQQQNQQVIQQLNSVVEFAELFQADENKITINSYNEPCLPFQYVYYLNTFYFIPRFCYQVDAIPDLISIPSTDQNSITMNKIISVLNQYSLLYDSQQLMVWFLQIVAISDSLYFSQFPFNVQIPGYNITNLPWYQNHMQEIEQNSKVEITHCTWQSDLFQGLQEVSTIQSILDKNNNVIGVVKQSVSIMNTTFPSIPYNVLLINQNGEIIYQNVGMIFDIWIPKSQDQITYIYNQSQTGFNYQDWLEIQQNTNATNSIPLYSKIYNQTVQIKSYYFANQNYTLLVYSNITNNQYLLSQIQLATDDINSLIVQWIFFIVLVTMILLLLGCFGLYYIFKPISYIILIQKNQISQFGNANTLKMLQLMNNKKNSQKNQLSILQNKVMNLQEQFNKRQFIKSNNCQLYEQYFFPKKEQSFASQIIKNNLSNVQCIKSEAIYQQGYINQFLRQ